MINPFIYCTIIDGVILPPHYLSNREDYVDSRLIFSTYYIFIQGLAKKITIIKRNILSSNLNDLT